MRSSGSSLADSGPRESLSLRLRGFAEGDLDAVLGPAAVVEVEALLSSTGAAEPETRDLQLAGGVHWARYLAQDPTAGRDDLLAAVEFFARVRRAQPDIVPPPVREALELPSGPDRGAAMAVAVEGNPGTVLSRADILLRHAMSHPGAASYEAVIEVLRPCLAAMGHDDPWRPRLLDKMSIAMMMRYNQVKSRGALQEMIDSLQETLAALSDELDPVIYRSQLVKALWWRAIASRDVGQLDEAIGALRSAISEVRAREPDDRVWLPGLEQGLRECEAAREAVLVPGSAGEALRLSNQALALWRSGGSAGGEQATAQSVIEMLRRAVELTPDWPNRAVMLVNLSSALLAQGRAMGSADLLTECRAVLVEAVDQVGPDSAAKSYWPLVLANLALASVSLYWLSRDPGMATEATRRMQEALAAAPEGSPRHFELLPDAGQIWSMVAETRRDPRVLDQVLPMLRAAAADDRHPHDREGLYSTLGMVLHTRGALSGELADLAAAVSACHMALKFASPVNRRELLANLALTLTDQYQLDNQITVLLNAVAYARQAVAGLPAEQFAAGRSTLAATLYAMFRRTGDSAHLDEALEMQRTAVRVAAVKDPLRARYLSNLGAMLLTAHERRDGPAMLTEAVRVLREAVSASPPQDAELPVRLCNYGLALGWLLGSGGEVSLSEALAVAQRAADIVAHDDPFRVSVLLNLAVILEIARIRGYGGDTRAPARAAARAAADVDTAAPSDRLKALRRLGGLAADDHDWAGALDAYRAAVALLPALPARYLSRPDQEDALRRQSGLATEAAACALRRAAPAEAVQLLEMGRGVMLAQALESRSDVTDLRSAHPELAEEFARLRDQLAGSPSARSPGVLLAGFESAQRAHRSAEERRNTAKDWERLHERIRAMPGFSRFNLPPEGADIRALAAQGPIIVVNQSRYGTDAILVTADGITSVPLSAATEDAIGSIRVSMSAAQAERQEGTLSGLDRSARVLDDILGWLWDAIAEPVLNSLGITVPASPDGPKPHIWWLPTGSLALLPLHAAGHHCGQSSGRTVFDRVVSSYTPTLAVLRHARHVQAGDMIAPPLVVSLPATPGQAPLPGAEQESAMLRERYPGATVLTDATATRDNVLKALPDHRWVHFACHASSDLANPSESCLLLHDYQRSPLTVLDVSRLRLGQASLAYLSACSTGEVSATLPDEVIHIASAFQLAGYADVIATMWQVPDRVAVTLAETVYRGITDQRQPVAEALHQTVTRLRDRYPADPWRWANFFHAGR